MSVARAYGGTEALTALALVPMPILAGGVYWYTSTAHRRYRAQLLAECLHSSAQILRTQARRFDPQPESQALLATMNQRQDLQLKLQSTVEGLSVAAVTYYGSGLVGYLAKGAHALGLQVQPEVAVAVMAGWSGGCGAADAYRAGTCLSRSTRGRPSVPWIA